MLNQAWFYVGRSRGRSCYKLDKHSEWDSVLALGNKAKTNKSVYIGTGILNKTKKSQCKCHFIVYLGKPKGRKFKRQKGMVYHPDTQKHYSALHKEPWILVTNLSPNNVVVNPENLMLKQQENILANRLVKLYSTRMQIEQNFRDDKNPRWGFGWRHGKSKKQNCIMALILIATIASIILILIGTEAERQKKQYRYQANTCKSHRVLSLLYLAKQIILHEYIQISGRDFMKNAIKTFNSNYNTMIAESTVGELK